MIAVCRFHVSLFSTCLIASLCINFSVASLFFSPFSHISLSNWHTFSLQVLSLLYTVFMFLFFFFYILDCFTLHQFFGRFTLLFSLFSHVFFSSGIHFFSSSFTFALHSFRFFFCQHTKLYLASILRSLPSSFRFSCIFPPRANNFLLKFYHCFG